MPSIAATAVTEGDDVDQLEEQSPSIEASTVKLRGDDRQPKKQDDDYKGNRLSRKMARDLGLTQNVCKGALGWLADAIQDSLSKHGEFHLPSVCKFQMVPKQPTKRHGKKHRETRFDDKLLKKHSDEKGVDMGHLVIKTCFVHVKLCFTVQTQGVIDMSPTSRAREEDQQKKAPKGRATRSCSAISKASRVG